jgi:pyruvate kinase
MHSLFKRKVKIVCTLGPASTTLEQISGLVEAGMDIARLNFSHGTHAQHLVVIQNIREASRLAGRPITIMQDLQGPKLRAGVLPKGGIDLKKGEICLLFPEGSTPKTPSEGKTLIPISAEIAHSICADLQKGSRILFDDGKIETRCIAVASPEMVVEIENGGKLTSNKGMNLPGTPLSMSCLTEKDLEDLKFGLDQGVDAVALSFVRTVQDIEELREKMRKHVDSKTGQKLTSFPLVVAKIEREEAIEYMDAIVEATDVLMVARGDMAVEIGAQKVPIVQKQLIQSCNELGVPVITATQMLESMISCPSPTRAEASDVANAVFDGTDCVMLSAESASGQYPFEAVSTMSRIIVEAETGMASYSRHHKIHPIPGSIVDAIESSAAVMAQQVGAVAIACLTHSGMAARTLAKYRPDAPIVAIMDEESELRKLGFVWGVRGAIIPKIVGTDDIFSMVEKVLQDNKWASMEDLIVLTAGVPTLRRGTTNMVKIHRVGVQSERAPRST